MVSTTNPLQSMSMKVDDNDYYGLKGDLTFSKYGLDLVGKSVSIVRKFESQSGQRALLATGGSQLARHSSFDPNFETANKWISSHAVGSSIGSPVLASGVFCALIEAWFPVSVQISSEIKHKKPIFLGMELVATITVIDVTDASSKDKKTNINGSPISSKGFESTLKAELRSQRDGEILVDGKYKIWLPDFTH